MKLATKKKILFEDVKYMCQLVHAKDYAKKSYTYKELREMFDVIVFGLEEDEFKHRYK